MSDILLAEYSLGPNFHTEVFEGLAGGDLTAVKHDASALHDTEGLALPHVESVPIGDGMGFSDCQQSLKLLWVRNVISIEKLKKQTIYI